MRRNLASATLLLLLTSSTLMALDGHDARQLHALIVADTADRNVGAMVDIDGKNFYNLLTDEIPANRRGRVGVLKGNRVTKNELFQAIDQMPVQPNDSVFLYFTGHGAFVQDQGQVLKMTDGEIVLRKTILDHLKGKGARLTVLITDACSNIITSKLKLYASMAEGIDHDVCRYLFFRHTGVVDLHAAAPGEEAIALKDIGSIFTHSLIAVLQQPNSAFQQTPITWREVAGQVTDRTKERFRMEYESSRDFQLLFPGQTTQTVKAAGLGEPIPVPIPKAQWRLGIRMVDAGGQGVRITEVFPHSQAEWAGIQVGEILFRVETGRVDPQVTHIRTTADIG
ncbi:MAG: caspase family protein, partial [Planctomycetaceae bacterium]|nr:caspase family protein [Planctomycetaceae bacterium]